MAMSTREFIQHLLLNCELDDPISIEVVLPAELHRKVLSYEPAHVTRLGEEFGEAMTLIECKPYKGE